MNSQLYAADIAAAGRAALFAGLLSAVPTSIAQDYGDTPYVQTPQNVVDKMLEIAKVGPKDYVIDLGSGDGRMVITAAKKHGARGFGVDLDRRLVRLANKRAAEAGVADRAVFYERDLYKTDVRRATVVTIYLLPEVNLMVRPKLLSSLRPGTRVVSHDYDMGEWPPDASLVLDAPDKPVGRDFKSKIFYWVVPATASGKWRWQMPGGDGKKTFELTLDQMFQKIEGTLAVNGKPARLEQATLSGRNIRIEATAMEDGAPVHYAFAGRVRNDKIDGKANVRDGGGDRQLAWQAQRTVASEPGHARLKPPPPPENPW